VVGGPASTVVAVSDDGVILGLKLHADGCSSGPSFALGSVSSGSFASGSVGPGSSGGGSVLSSA
jgi:hypothetical protein